MPFAPFLALTIVAMLLLVPYAVLVTWERERAAPLDDGTRRDSPVTRNV
jgi:hypothetical protein